MNKAVLLCRVSTEAQDYEAQISDLKKYAQSQGMTECHVIATKESGFKRIQEREGWRQAKDFFASHPDYDTLIVTEISRLGRKESAIVEIKEYMEENKKSLFIKDLNLQVYDKGKKKPESDIVFSIYASMATTEMSIKKDRFLRSKRLLNEQGYSITGKVLFGYTRVRDEVKGKNKFVVNEKEAKEINEIYNIYLYGLDGKDIGIKGLVVYAISKGMSSYLHSKRNVTKMLSERAYVGGIKEVRIKRKNPQYWYFNDHTKPTHIETISHIPYLAIVTQSLFDAVQQKKLNNRIQVDKSTKHETILSKLLECHECHTYMIGDYRRDKQRASYRCSKHKGGLGKCSNSSTISMPYIDSLVWCYLKANVKQIIEEIHKKNTEENISSIKREIYNCQDKKKSLQDEVITLSVIFKKEVRVLGLEIAQQKYDIAMSKIEKQMREIDDMIDAHKKKIADINMSASTSLTDEDMDRVEHDKKQISEYIHLLVKKVYCFNYGTYSFIRVILNGDNDRTFRGIIACKRDTIRIQAYGFKREKDMPFKIKNMDIYDEDGNIVDWAESGLEVFEGLLRMDYDIELQPIAFKRLQVYDDDLK